MTAMLCATGIGKRYADFTALADVGFEVAPRECLAVIGPNGAGKTTLFKTLTGEVFPDAGTVIFDGIDITRLAPERRARIGFGRTFQIARVFLASTVAENLVVAIEARDRAAGRRNGAWYAVAPAPAVRDEAAHMAGLVGLSPRLGLEARHLSHGDRKRLEIAAMLCLQPRILMLDEPTAGMSPAERQGSVELIQRLRHEQNLTVMLTEHDMDVVFGLSDRILVLNAGRVIACDRPEAIRAHPRVRAVYLGSDAV